ncbi:MAG TPA: alpha/beta hydrolase [Roseiflexaceae bacterium]|nr:alpha/beta hydrolase [Roseiflexaceae bacterium]
MATWEGGDLIANGIRIHYTRTGGAKPPVVFAHGVTDDGLCWTPVAEALAADYDVIMVDARGHGRSEAPETGYDPATQAADLAGLIAGLGLRRPVVVGHSMGAVTTLVLAGSHPGVPGAIVLEDPPGWWLPAQSQQPAGADSEADSAARDTVAAERLAGIRAWFAGLRSKTREELIAEQRAATPGWSEAELGPWADSKLRVSPYVLSVFSGTPGAMVDWPQVLPRINCPALLITGDTEQGAILGGDGVAALQTWVPQLRIEHIGGAGHNVRRDQLARFLTVVQAFLRETAHSG